MSLLVADLVGVMDIDDSGFHQKLDRGEGRFSAVAGAIGRAALGVVKATGVGVAAAGAIGLRTASQLEQAEIGFTTMLGSAEAAKSFLSDLSKFAASTPFEFPQLQSAASRLVSVGVNANRVIPIMRVLGDSTAAMGTGAEGIDRATMALQQMQIKGKVTGEEMLQLAEAGVPAWEALAASLGVTTAKAQDMVTKGKVSVDQLFKAIESGSGASLQRVSGMMNVQAQSMAGLWSTLKDTVSVGLAQAIQPLIPMIKEGLGVAIAFAAEKAPQLQAGLAGAVTWVRNLIDAVRSGTADEGLAGWIQTILDTVRELRGGDTSAVSADLGTLRQSFTDLGPAVRDVADSLPSLPDLINLSASAIGFLADHADLLVDALPYLAAAFVLYKTAQGAANVVSVASIPIQAAQVVANFRLAAALRATAAASTQSAATQVAASGAVQASSLRASAAFLAAQARMVAGWIAAGATAVAQGAVMAGSMALNAARVVAGWVLMGTQSLIQAARMAAAWFIALGPVGWVIAAVIGLVALIIANWDTVVRWTKTAWSAVVDFVKAAAAWIVNVFMNWTLVGLIIKHWDSIRSGASSAWNAITSFISSIPGRIVSFFLNWTLPGLLISHWDSIRSSAVNKFNEVVSFVGGIPGRIISALGNLGSLLYGAGQDVIQSLINGIGSMVSRLAGAMKDAVARGITAFLPGSPVKAGPLRILNNGRAGGEIVRMLAAGLDTEWRALARRMGGGVSFAMPNAGGAGAAGTGSGISIGTLQVRAFSDRFSLRQVQEELYYAGVR